MLVNNNKKVKIAILGAGFIANEFAENMAFLSSEIEIEAIYSRTFETAQSFARKHCIANVYRSFEELLENKDIDAIYVATHNDSHYKYVINSLKAKKHVLCEKPAGINFKQLIEMIDIAKLNNVVFMEAMRLIYIPSYIYLKKLIKENYLGKIIHVESSLGRISSRTYRHNLNYCGGALMDLGIYCIYAIVDILGIPNKIKSYSLISEDKVDKITEGIFTYKESIANFNVSFVAKTRGELRIMFEKGVITMPSYFTETDQLIIDKVGCSKLEVKEFSKIGSGLIYEIQHFIGLIKNLHQENNHELAKNVIQTMDIIRQQQQIIFNHDTEEKTKFQS